MKTWTVVIEVTTELDFDKTGIERCLPAILEGVADSKMTKFRIMETIEAPYGPQHPNGVYLAEGPSGTVAEIEHGNVTFQPGRAGRVKS